MFQYFSKFTSSTLKHTLSYFQSSCNPQLINLWINDMQTGIDALFDDHLKLAQEIFGYYGTKSPFHSFGLAMLTYTIAMLDSEKSDDAINTISNVEIEIKRFLKKRKKEATTVGEIIPDEQQQHNCRKRKKSQREDAIDLHFELLSANCILMAATLQLLRANWIDHIKAAYDIRKALLIYERIFEFIQGVSISEYKSVFNQCINSKVNNNNKNNNNKPVHPSSTQKDTPFLFDETLEHGAYFGVGLFSLIFALLPPKVSKLLNNLGFKSSRSNAIQFLQNASNSRTMYAPLSAVALLSFYTNISIYIDPQLNHFLSLKDANSILERMKTRFSNGKIWLLLDSKLNRLKRNPNHCLNLLKQAKKSPSISLLSPSSSSLSSPPPSLSSQSSKFPFSKDTFQKDENDYSVATSISQLPQFRCFVLYDLGWSYIYVGDYFQASESFFCLASLSNWSRLFYHFLSTCCMIAQGTHEKAALEAQQILNMIDDKKRLGHKLSANELYAEGKIRDWFLISERHSKPLKFVLEHDIINPIWELVYLWNGISYWHPQVLEDTKQTIQNKLLNVKNNKNNDSDNKDDIDDDDDENKSGVSQTNSNTRIKNSTKNSTKNSNSSAYNGEDSAYSIMLLIMGVIERDIQHNNKIALEYFNTILRQPDEKTNWVFAYAMYETAVTHCKERKECSSSLTSTWIYRVEDYYIDHPDDTEWLTRMQLRCQLLQESQILLKSC